MQFLEKPWKIRGNIEISTYNNESRKDLFESNYHTTKCFSKHL